MEYDIYREELAIKYPAYGHALWDPNPGGRYTAVDIHEPLVLRIRSPTNTATLQANNLRSNGVLDRSDDHRRMASG